MIVILKYEFGYLKCITLKYIPRYTIYQIWEQIVIDCDCVNDFVMARTTRFCKLK